MFQPARNPPSLQSTTSSPLQPGDGQHLLEHNPKGRLPVLPSPLSAPLLSPFSMDSSPVQSGTPGMASPVQTLSQPMSVSVWRPIVRMAVPSGTPRPMSYIQLLPQYTSELTAGPIAPAPIQPGNPGLTSSGQLGPQSMSAPSPMARLPILSGQSQTVGSTASCRSKALSRLQPKAAKQSGRASLKTKLQHLQECLKYEQEYRELTGNEPEKRSYEKKRGLPEKYIPRLLAARDKLERMPAQTLSKRFNVRTRPFYPVEILLVKMISDIRDKHIPIDQRFLQLMAHEIYTLLLSQVGTLLFARPSFSVGWVYNFRRYWKIDYQQLKGKAGSVDMERIAGRIDEIKAIISD